MPPHESIVNELRHDREIARQGCPPVKFEVSLLRKAINSPGNMNANGQQPPKKSCTYVFDEKTGRLDAVVTKALKSS
ncbi:hypothetical protein F66182_8532 [Fusarium sp. NRRL 66182]|nr:hypothetical protein F66182_8532 [Fusarium sp. NRRL 66182]